MKSLENIRDYLSYDPVNGKFMWIKKPCDGIAVGTQAGSITNEGYRRIKFGGKEYRASRLAWFFVHGAMPPDDIEIDHKNHGRSDDWIDNLRLATQRQNHQNKSPHRNKKYSQFKGVSLNKKAGKGRQWQASIYVDKKLKHLGMFDDELAAASAYDAAAIKHFGEFAHINGVTP